MGLGLPPWNLGGWPPGGQGGLPPFVGHLDTQRRWFRPGPWWDQQRNLPGDASPQLPAPPDRNLDTNNPARYDEIVKWLRTLPYGALTDFGKSLLAEKPLAPQERDLLGEVDIRLREAEVADEVNLLGDVLHQGGVWTRAMISFGEEVWTTREAVMGGTSQSKTYREPTTKETERARQSDWDKELERSQHDSEVDTLDAARKVIDEDVLPAMALRQPGSELSRSHVLRIKVIGNTGPCDGCKERLVTFKEDVVGRLKERLSKGSESTSGLPEVIVESLYSVRGSKGPTYPKRRGKGEGGVWTSYGYQGAEEERTALDRRMWKYTVVGP